MLSISWAPALVWGGRLCVPPHPSAQGPASVPADINPKPGPGLSFEPAVGARVSYQPHAQAVPRWQGWSPLRSPPNSRLGGLLAAPPQDRDQSQGGLRFDFWFIPRSGHVCPRPHGTPPPTKLPPHPIRPHPCRQPMAFWPAWEEESGLSPPPHRELSTGLGHGP